MWYVVNFGCGGWTLIDAVQAVWLNYAKLRLSLVLRAIIVDLIIEIASGPLSFFAFGVLFEFRFYWSYDEKGCRLTSRIGIVGWIIEFPSLFCLLPSIEDSHSSCAARGNINEIFFFNCVIEEANIDWLSWLRFERKRTNKIGRSLLLSN